MTRIMTIYAKAAIIGGQEPVSARYYCGAYVFEGDSLTMANFGGGYFGGDGKPYYRHGDWQGSVTMVTDGGHNLVQHTGYYPYGEPWREPSGQPYLYGGKERMRDGGLYEYDHGARRLCSALPLWNAPDPLALKYAPVNPYAYCASNPIKFTDPTGKNIVVLYATTENTTVGHLAMLIQDENGKYKYYSFNGKNKDNDVGVGSWDSAQDFLDSDYNRATNDDGVNDSSVNGYAYAKGYEIESNAEQDAKMSDKFSEISETGYNFYSNNCVTTVRSSMDAGDISTTSNLVKGILCHASIALGSFGFMVAKDATKIPLWAYALIKSANTKSGREFTKSEEMKACELKKEEMEKDKDGMQIIIR